MKRIIILKTKRVVLKRQVEQAVRDSEGVQTPYWLGRALLLFSVMLPFLISCSGNTRTRPSLDKNTNPILSSSANTSLQVVAAENFWGSIATQIGGDRIKVTSIITNPNTDPHNYEPKPTDARTIANARYIILNGAGYDPWGQKLVDANPVNGRKVLNIGDLVGKKSGDNPHLWYSPEYIMRVVDQITDDFKKLDPQNATYFDQQRQQFVSVGLKDYNSTINTIKQKYHDTPVGSTENIFAYMSQTLGLNLITPPKFMTAISENQEPTVADKVTFDQQIAHKQIKVLQLTELNTRHKRINAKSPKCRYSSCSHHRDAHSSDY